MKNTLTILMLIISMSVAAQGKKEKFNPQKFLAELETRIIEEANLTQQEAAKFIPVYREMSKKQHHLYKQLKSYRRLDNADEDAYKKAIVSTDDIEVKLKKIQQQYHQKFLNILPASKVYNILRIEKRFHRQEFSKKISREHPNR